MSTATKEKPTTTETDTPESVEQRLRRIAAELSEIHPENFPHLFDGGSKNPAWESLDQLTEKLAAARKIADEPAQCQRREIKRLADELLGCDWNCLPPGLVDGKSPEVWKSLTALHREIQSAMGTRKL